MSQIKEFFLYLNVQWSGREDINDPAE